MPQSAAPLPPNQPTAPPGPLTLGDLFSSTVATYRKGWKLFFALVLAPILISLVGLLVLAGVAAAIIVPQAMSGRADPASMIGSIAGISVLAIIVVLLISLLSYVFYCRIMLATLDYATGRTTPTWATLTERTRGLMGRLFGLVLIYLGIGVAAYLVLILGVFATVAASGGNQPGAGAVFGLVILTLAFFVAAIWFSTKVVYTLTIMAEEGLKAWDAIKRSFALTAGAWWRTFGYILVIGIVIGVISSIPQGLITAGAQSAAQGNGASAGVFIGSLLVMVINFVLLPVQQIWVALMYLGRTRELSNATAGYSGGAPGAPWADQGQPFGQSPEQYSDQPYDAPGGRYAADPQQGYGAADPGQDPFGQPGRYGAPGQDSGQYGTPSQDSGRYGAPGQDSGQYGAPGQDSGRYGDPSDPYGRPADGQPGSPSDGAYHQPGSDGGNAPKPGDEGEPPADGDFFGRPKN